MMTILTMNIWLRNCIYVRFLFFREIVIVFSQHFYYTETIPLQHIGISFREGRFHV